MSLTHSENKIKINVKVYKIMGSIYIGLNVRTKKLRL